MYVGPYSTSHNAVTYTTTYYVSTIAERPRFPCKCVDRALCGCVVNSLVHFFADFTPYLKSIFVIFTLRYSFRPLDYCRIHCLTFSNVALNLDNFSSLMVGVTYLNCDLRSLRAKAAKLDKRVRELIDDLHIIQRRHKPRGCRDGRLARRDAKLPKVVTNPSTNRDRSTTCRTMKDRFS